MQDGRVQELSEGWETTLALGLEPLPCLYSRAEETDGLIMSSRVIGLPADERRRRKAGQATGGAGDRVRPRVVGVRAYFDLDWTLDDDDDSSRRMTPAEGGPAE